MYGIVATTDKQAGHDDAEPAHANRDVVVFSYAPRPARIAVRRRPFARPWRPHQTERMREIQIVDAAELAALYTAAAYAVVVDGDAIALRVGEPSPDLEAYLPADTYVLVSAWNPASEPRSDAANEAADAALVARLDAAGIARQSAWASAPDGQWREPGWLLTGVEQAAADRLAVDFGQAAVLSWQRGQPVRLRMLLAPPAEAARAAHVDWIGA